MEGILKVGFGSRLLIQILTPFDSVSCRNDLWRLRKSCSIGVVQFNWRKECHNRHDLKGGIRNRYSLKGRLHERNRQDGKIGRIHSIVLKPFLKTSSHFNGTHLLNHPMLFAEKVAVSQVEIADEHFVGKESYQCNDPIPRRRTDPH